MVLLDLPHIKLFCFLGEDVALTMNNLGGLSELEMYILSRKAIEYIGLEYFHNFQPKISRP